MLTEWSHGQTPSKATQTTPMPSLTPCSNLSGRGRDFEGMARSQNSPGRPDPPEAVQTPPEASKGEWLDALFGLLLLEVLPCTALWVAGHLLLLLVARPEIGNVLTLPLDLNNGVW